MNTVDQLPDLRVLSIIQTPPCLDIPDPMYSRWLSKNNGAAALDGALRLFGATEEGALASVHIWNSRPIWKYAFGRLAPTAIFIFGEDAFGVQFGFSSDGTVHRFWPDTGETESLEMSANEFFEVVADDPDGTVSYQLYRDAQLHLGKLGLREHFAFKVELAVGGALDVSNLQRMDAISHLQVSAKVALQIHGIPPGTLFDPKVE